MAKGNKSVIAEALAQAALEADAVVAERYGVKVQTLRGWRRKLATDDELAALHVSARAIIIGAWRDEQALTYVALLRRMRKLTDEGKPIPIEVTGPVRILGASLIEAASLLDLEPDVSPRTSATGPNVTDKREGKKGAGRG